MDFATLHLYLHFLLPLPLAILCLKPWKKVTPLSTFLQQQKNTIIQTYLVLIATMAVDLDHLLATPIYSPGRCSIGFHPLHHEIAITCYVFMLAFKPTRLIAIGLLLHMLLDGLDCIY